MNFRIFSLYYTFLFSFFFTNFQCNLQLNTSSDGEVSNQINEFSHGITLSWIFVFSHIFLFYFCSVTKEFSPFFPLPQTKRICINTEGKTSGEEAIKIAYYSKTNTCLKYELEERREGFKCGFCHENFLRTS